MICGGRYGGTIATQYEGFIDTRIDSTQANIIHKFPTYYICDPKRNIQSVGRTCESSLGLTMSGQAVLDSVGY